MNNVKGIHAVMKDVYMTKIMFVVTVIALMPITEKRPCWERGEGVVGS